MQVSSDVCDAFMLVETNIPAPESADGAAAYASGDSGGYGGFSGNGVTENGYSDHNGSNTGRPPATIDARTAPLGSDTRFNERGGNHVRSPLSPTSHVCTAASIP